MVQGGFYRYPCCLTLPGPKVTSLSKYSDIVRNMQPIRKVMLFVRPEDRDEARRRLESLKGD